MCFYRSAIIGFIFIIMAFSGRAMALPLQNDDFSDGLNGWTSLGDVKEQNGTAVLGDNAATYSLLQQAIPLATGNYTIEFDFKNQMSGAVPQGVFRDTFYASLYFIDDLNEFNLDSGGFDDALLLLSLDDNRVFDNSGTIDINAKGDDWQHTKVSFHNEYAYIIPAFELFDFNDVNNDSTVLIDNVIIQAPTTIPEPATFVLLGCGMLCFFIIKARKLNA